MIACGFCTLHEIRTKARRILYLAPDSWGGNNPNKQTLIMFACDECARVHAGREKPVEGQGR